MINNYYSYKNFLHRIDPDEIEHDQNLDAQTTDSELVHNNSGFVIITTIPSHAELSVLKH